MSMSNWLTSARCLDEYIEAQSSCDNGNAKITKIIDKPTRIDEDYIGNSVLLDIGYDAEEDKVIAKYSNDDGITFKDCVGFPETLHGYSEDPISTFTQFFYVNGNRTIMTLFRGAMFNETTQTYSYKSVFYASGDGENWEHFVSVDEFVYGFCGGGDYVCLGCGNSAIMINVGTLQQTVINDIQGSFTHVKHLSNNSFIVMAENSEYVKYVVYENNGTIGYLEVPYRDFSNYARIVGVVTYGDSVLIAEAPINLIQGTNTIKFYKADDWNVVGSWTTSTISISSSLAQSSSPIARHNFISDKNYVVFMLDGMTKMLYSEDFGTTWETETKTFDKNSAKYGISVLYKVGEDDYRIATSGGDIRINGVWKTYTPITHTGFEYCLQEDDATNELNYGKYKRNYLPKFKLLTNGGTLRYLMIVGDYKTGEYPVDFDIEIGKSGNLVDPTPDLQGKYHYRGLDKLADGTFNTQTWYRIENNNQVCCIVDLGEIKNIDNAIYINITKWSKQNTTTKLSYIGFDLRYMINDRNLLKSFTINDSVKSDSNAGFALKYNDASVILYNIKRDITGTYTIRYETYDNGDFVSFTTKQFKTVDFIDLLLNNQQDNLFKFYIKTVDEDNFNLIGKFYTDKIEFNSQSVDMSITLYDYLKRLQDIEYRGPNYRNKYIGRVQTDNLNNILNYIKLDLEQYYNIRCNFANNIGSNIIVDNVIFDANTTWELLENCCWLGMFHICADHNSEEYDIKIVEE